MFEYELRCRDFPPTSHTASQGASAAKARVCASPPSPLPAGLGCEEAEKVKQSLEDYGQNIVSGSGDTFEGTKRGSMITGASESDLAKERAKLEKEGIISPVSSPVQEDLKDVYVILDRSRTFFSSLTHFFFSTHNTHTHTNRYNPSTKRGSMVNCASDEQLAKERKKLEDQGLILRSPSQEKVKDVYVSLRVLSLPLKPQRPHKHTHLIQIQSVNQKRQHVQ